MRRPTLLALFAASLIFVPRAVFAEIDFDPAPDSTSPSKPPAVTATPAPVSPPPAPIATPKPDPTPFTLSSPPTLPPTNVPEPEPTQPPTPKPVTFISKIYVTASPSPAPTKAPTKTLLNPAQERRYYFFNKLNLTDDQRDQIKQIYRSNSDPKEARRQMMQVLTEDQREQLKELIEKWRVSHPSPVE